MGYGFSGYSPNSAMGEWWQGNNIANNLAPYNYQQAGFDPENMFGQTMIGPNGEQVQITPQMIQQFQHMMDMQGVRNKWDIAGADNIGRADNGWLSPGNYRSVIGPNGTLVDMTRSGDLRFNMDALGLGIGTGGGVSVGDGGAGGYGGWEGGPVATPDAYSESPWAGPTVDPRAAIEAAQPRIKERMMNDFAEAGNRLGQSGFAMSTPYTGEAGLGGAARRAAADQAEIENRYTYDASKFNSAQEAQAYQAMMQRKFGGWGQKGGWDMAANLADQGNQFGAWQQMGNWNQMGLDRNLQAQMFNSQMNNNNNNMQAQILMSMLGRFI